MTEPSTARVPALDALRGVAILAVVLLHVTFAFLRHTPMPSSAGTVLLALHLLTGFGVPLFVAVSTAGLCLGRRDAGASPGAYLDFLAARARRILPPYVVWSTVMLLGRQPEKLLHPTTYVRLLALGAIRYHLYFVPLICQLYVLWPLLERLGRPATRSIPWALAIAIAGFAVSLTWWQLGAAGLVGTGVLTLVPLWFGYATLGLAVGPWLRTAIARSRTSRAGAGVAATLTTVAAALMFGHVRTLVTLYPTGLELAVTIFQWRSAFYALTAMALALIVVARLEGTAVHRALSGLGARSYGIYLVHVLVLDLLVFGYVFALDDPRVSGVASIARPLAAWAACVVASDALVRLVAAWPALRPIAGVAPEAVTNARRSG